MTLSINLLKLEVKTLDHTLTKMLKEAELGNIAPLTKKQATALVNTLPKRQREVDFETLSNTLIKVQALPRSRHYPKG